MYMYILFPQVNMYFVGPLPESEQVSISEFLDLVFSQEHVLVLYFKNHARAVVLKWFDIHVDCMQYYSPPQKAQGFPLLLTPYFKSGSGG